MIHPKHVAFAKAVVALAREHHMTQICMSFCADFSRHMEGVPHEKVDLVWSQGRHGAEENIHLHMNVRLTTTEKVTPE